MSSKKQHFTVQVLKMICLALGITIETDFAHRLVKLFAYYILFVLCPFNFYTQWRAIFTYDSFLYKIDGFVYFCASFSISLMLAFAQLYRHKIQTIILEVQSNPLFDKQFFLICDRKMRYTVVPLFFVVSLLLSMLGVASIAAVLYTDAELGSPPTLIYPAIHPWPVHTVPWYTFTLCHESFSAGVAGSVLLAQFLFLLCARIIASILLDLEAEALQQLSRIDKPPRLPNDNLKSKLDVQLKSVLDKHYAIMSFMNKVKDVCQPFFNLNTTNAIATNTFMTVIFVKVQDNNFYRLKMLSTQTISVICFTFFCFIGESMSHMNGYFSNRIYNMPWYNWSTTVRKNLVITLAIHQKPFNIKFLHITPINRYFLGLCVKRTYSAIQLLLNTQK